MNDFKYEDSPEYWKQKRIDEENEKARQRAGRKFSIIYNSIVFGLLILTLIKWLLFSGE